MKQQLLLYDDQCPLCSWYSGLFIRKGFLAPEGRLPFCQWNNTPSVKVDLLRARNKIALVNPENGTVVYGIDSLLEIIGNRFPLVRTIGHFPVVHGLLELLYAFISYNRKVIAAPGEQIACGCVPDRSLFWRGLYILFAAFLVNSITYRFFTHHLSGFFHGSAQTDLVFFVAQLLFQGMVFAVFKQRNFYDYSGHLATISIIGAVLLYTSDLFLELTAYLGLATDMLQPLFFGCVLTTMFFLHKHRIRQLHWSPVLSISWIVFRIGIYPFAFNL